MNSVLRIGLLGAARIALRALIYPARQLPEVQAAAVASRDAGRARAFAARHGVPCVHETYEALLADPEIHAVYVALPNSLHAQWSIAALQAGKHVLCEKPMAANADEAARMAEAAVKSGLILAEAFHYRYHPLALRVKEIAASGELGAIHHLEAHFCVPAWRLGHIAFRYDLAGGATMDVGCYPVNLLRWLTEAEPEVFDARPRLSSPQIDRSMRVTLRFPKDQTGRMTCSLLSMVLLRSSARMVGNQGELRILNPFQPHWYHRLSIRSRHGFRVERFSRQTTYAYQLRAFVRAVHEKAPMTTGPVDAIANMRVIDQIYAKAGLKRRGI